MSRNDRLLRTLVRKLTTARHKPPTISSLLLHWSSLPGLTLVGVVVVVPMLALDLPTFGPMLIAGICLGAACRDLGIAIRAVRFWPIQKELLDWPKIDALAQGMADLPGQSIATSLPPPSG